MRSTKFMEKLKGIQQKKQNFINSNYNADKSSSDNINTKTNTNIINEQSNNYLISNNFNTINGSSYLNNIKINNKNFSNFHNNNLKEKILKDKDKMNENELDSIFNNQEIILDKIENLENVLMNMGNLHKKNNSNNEILSSFNSQMQSIAVINNNSMPSESPKSNNQKNQS